MIISHRYRFIFVKTAKTAGTSIETYLSQHCDAADILTPFAFPEEGHEPRNYRGRFNPVPELLARLRMNGVGPRRNGWRDTMRDFVYARKFWHHMPAWQIQRRVPHSVWRAYFKFCVERNPWDKVLSGYHYYKAKRGVELSLDAYIELLADRKARRLPGVGSFPINFYIYSDPRTNETLVDRICRYESLDEELNSVFDRLGVPFAGTLPVQAKAGFRSKRRSYREILTSKQQKRIAEIFREEIELHQYQF